MHEVIEVVSTFIEFIRHHNEIMLLFIPILLLLFPIISKFKAIPTRMQSFVEIIYEFLEEQFQSLFKNRKDYRNWMPFLLALFFYIFINNILGLIPGIHPYTSEIVFTASLAILVIVISIIVGMKRYGPIKYLVNLTPSGISIPMKIFMFPIEVISLLAKPFSLALRLYVNMFAGHTIILVLASLSDFVGSYVLVPFDILLVLMMLFFESLVSLIQAFIFCYLSAFYISDALYIAEH